MSEFKNIKVLTAASMLAAVAILLGLFKVPLAPIIEIRFGWLPVAAAGALFGPVVAPMVGLIGDIGGYLVRPTGTFMLGFTVSAILSGLIWGLMLHRRSFSVPRIVVAQAIVSLVVELLLNSLWLSMLYGNPFFFVLGSRVLKTAVMFPVQVLMLTLVLRFVPNRRLMPEQKRV